MAIVVFGGGVAGIRGTVGGMTFSANKAGPYVRLWTKGRRPESVRRSVVQSEFGRTPYFWSGLSEGERDEWDAFGGDPNEYDWNSLGEQYWLSGYEWATRCLVRRHEVGIGDPTGVPVGPGAVAPASAAVSLEDGPEGECLVTYAPGTFAAGDSLIVNMALYPNAARRGIVSGYYAVAREYEPGATSHDMSEWVRERFGTLIAGQKGFCKIWLQNVGGNRSTAVLRTAIVASA